MENLRKQTGQERVKEWWLAKKATEKFNKRRFDALVRKLTIIDVTHTIDDLKGYFKFSQNEIDSLIYKIIHVEDSEEKCNALFNKYQKEFLAIEEDINSGFKSYKENIML